jgi:hypothetical protein
MPSLNETVVGAPLPLVATAEEVSSEESLFGDAISKDILSSLLSTASGLEAYGESAEVQRLMDVAMSSIPEPLDFDKGKVQAEQSTLFEKLEQDTLFFAFYFQPGTLQQYCMSGTALTGLGILRRGS